MRYKLSEIKLGNNITSLKRIIGAIKEGNRRQRQRNNIEFYEVYIDFPLPSYIKTQRIK